VGVVVRNLCVTLWNRHVVSKEVAGITEGNRNRISEILSVFCNDPTTPFFVRAFLCGIPCLTNCGLFSSNRSLFLRRTTWAVSSNALDGWRRILRLQRDLTRFFRSTAATLMRAWT
jgi:hypothetical protein